MAKGMGNGFPVGGILIAPHIHSKYFMLGTTFGGNQLACAASLAVLEIIEEENLIEQAAENGSFLLNELQKLDEIKNVRGKGLMIGFDVPESLKDLKKNLLYKQHIFTGESKPNTIRLLPALNISKKEIVQFLEALEKEIVFLTSKKISAINQ
jgi:acetylornithine aminotransferase